MGFTLMMSISFLLSLLVAWEQLYAAGFRIAGSAFGSYAFMITGLFAFHILIAIFFLFSQFFAYVRATRDPVKQLILTTNPYQMVRLKMLVTCWNFLDIVWLAIAINFFIVL